MTDAAASALDAAAIVKRLVDAGLLSRRDVVDGEVVLRDVSRSNSVYVVEGYGLVAKSGLAERLGDQGSSERERLLHRAVAARPELVATAPVPALVADLGDMFVMSRVTPGETLEERRHGAGWSDEPELFGWAVGHWHGLAADIPLDLPARLPWILASLGDEPPAFVVDHPGMSQLRDHLAGDPALIDAFAAARDRWRPTSVVHGDIRWDNALIASEPSGGDRVILVDWEFVDRGDPAWDVAGGLADAIATATDVSEGAEAIVAQVEPYAAGFLAGYRRGIAARSDLDGPHPASVPLLAVRLVQIGFQAAAWDDTDGVATGRRLGELAAAIVRSPPAWTGMDG